MSYSASAAIQVSLDGVTYYSLTDHNRQPFNIEYDLVEKANRMADGTMRKFVVAKKRKVSVAWDMIPSGTGLVYNPTSSAVLNSGLTMTVDGNKGAAWMKSFYETNLFNPIYLKVVHSQDTASANSDFAFKASPSSSAVETMRCFINSFSYDVQKRFTYSDFVNVKMDFVEI
jgi:hypothetical protein